MAGEIKIFHFLFKVVCVISTAGDVHSSGNVCIMTVALPSPGSLSCLGSHFKMADVPAQSCFVPHFKMADVPPDVPAQFFSLPVGVTYLVHAVQL